jgi:hypothetical protein
MPVESHRHHPLDSGVVVKGAVTITLFVGQSANLAFREIAGLKGTPPADPGLTGPRPRSPARDAAGRTTTPSPRVDDGEDWPNPPEARTRTAGQASLSR